MFAKKGRIKGRDFPKQQSGLKPVSDSVEDWISNQNDTELIKMQDLKKELLFITDGTGFQFSVYNL